MTAIGITTWLFVLLAAPAAAAILALLPYPRTSEIVARFGSIAAFGAACAVLVSGVAGGGAATSASTH